MIAASINYWTVNVRRRWYATELAEVEHGARRLAEQPHAGHDPVAALAAGSGQ